jgi:5-methylcytosine-specific restriction endonuclease McrA
MLRFLEAAFASGGTHWESSDVESLAANVVPDAVFRLRKPVLVADVTVTWAQWFIQSFIDAAAPNAAYTSYAHIVKDVLPAVQRLMPQAPTDETNALAFRIARIALEQIEIKADRRRENLSAENREDILDLAGKQPRCWICGYRFSDWAVRRFLTKDEHASVTLPLFIDYVTGHGMRERDLSIEIDHVVPVAAGGRNDDNLRIACGWCNSRKKDYVSIYDVGSVPKVFHHPHLGVTSVPQPFWVVRLLALRKRCESSTGCNRTTANSRLFIGPLNATGAMNPVNLTVRCADHDELRNHRLVPRSLFKTPQ